MKPESGPDGMLLCGDADDVLRCLALDPKLRGSVKLAYLDPPFEPANVFPTSGEQAKSAWTRMLETCLSALQPLLSSSSEVWFHINPGGCEVGRALLDESFGADRRWLTVVWERDPHTGFGNRDPCEGGPHNVLLVYTTDRRGPHRLEHWSSSQTGSMTEAAGELSAIKRVRRQFPHAKPRRLIRQIIERCTNLGDLVLDPFAGSGTVGEVALELGRKWIGIERDRDTITEIIVPRLSRFDVGVRSPR